MEVARHVIYKDQLNYSIKLLMTPDKPFSIVFILQDPRVDHPAGVEESLDRLLRGDQRRPVLPSSGGCDAFGGLPVRQKTDEGDSF